MEPYKTPDELPDEFDRLRAELEGAIRSDLPPEEISRRTGQLLQQMQAYIDAQLDEPPREVPAGPRSIFHECTPGSLKILRLACALARSKDATEPSPDDLFQALVDAETVAGNVLANFGYQRSQSVESDTDRLEEMVYVSQWLQMVAGLALSRSHELGTHYAGPEHLLLAMLDLHPEFFSDPGGINASVLAFLPRLD